MPPRRQSQRSRKNTQRQNLEVDVEIELDGGNQDEITAPNAPEYIEIGANDLNEGLVESIGDAVDSGPLISDNATVPLSFSPSIFPRNMRLKMRKAHLILSMAALKHALLLPRWHLGASLVAAQAVSFLPKHILRIFDKRMLEDGKSLKNSMFMLANWWKNNFQIKVATRSWENTQLLYRLRAALLKKSAIAEDYVLVLDGYYELLERLVDFCLDLL